MREVDSDSGIAVESAASGELQFGSFVVVVNPHTEIGSADPGSQSVVVVIAAAAAEVGNPSAEAA